MDPKTPAEAFFDNFEHPHTMNDFRDYLENTGTLEVLHTGFDSLYEKTKRPKKPMRLFIDVIKSEVTGLKALQHLEAENNQIREKIKDVRAENAILRNLIKSRKIERAEARAAYAASLRPKTPFQSSRTRAAGKKHK